jgi:hypothetical protein
VAVIVAKATVACGTRPSSHSLTFELYLQEPTGWTMKSSAGPDGRVPRLKPTNYQVNYSGCEPGLWLAHADVAATDANGVHASGYAEQKATIAAAQCQQV